MPTLAFSLELRGSGLMEASDDSISLAKDSIGFGQNNFPRVIINVSSGSAAAQLVDQQIHNKATIAQGASTTITFASFTDALGDIFTPDNIKYAIFVIDSPDGLKSLAVGPQGDAAALALGIAGTVTPANAKLSFKHFHIFGDPINGIAPGTKLILTNDGTGSLTVNWWLIGERT